MAGIQERLDRMTPEKALDGNWGGIEKNPASGYG